jgi:hypothetical protein
MSLSRDQRIAAIQHRRRQRATLEELAKLSSGPKDLALVALPPEESLQLIAAQHSSTALLRKGNAIRRERFSTTSAAIKAFCSGLGELCSRGLWSFQWQAGYIGYFSGAISPLVLKRWIDTRHDGFLVAEADLSRGRALDSVIDDSYEGSFIEIESWGSLGSEGDLASSPS